MDKVTGARSLRARGVGPRAQGRAAQPEKGKEGGGAGHRDGQTVGWEGHEQQATFVFSVLVFVSGGVSINTKT